MKKINVLFVLMMMVAGVVSAQTNWALDKGHSKVGFVVTHMVVSEVEGQFKDFDIKLATTAEDFNGADVEFTANIASIDTENERRDGHLKSADFFEAEKYPTTKFKGKLEKVGGKYQLKGDLTLKDVTKPIVMEVAYNGSIDTGRGVVAGFKATGKFNRQDYNLKWSNKLQNGSAVVSDEVQIVAKIEMKKQA